MDALLLLAVLACPVGMGLMMWFVGKSMQAGGKPSADAEPAAGHGPRSVTELRAVQAHLSSEIERLERGADAHDGQRAKG